MTIKSAKDSTPMEPAPAASEETEKTKETLLAVQKEVLENTVRTEPTYGQLKETVKRLEEALERAAQAAAKDRAKAATAEEETERVRSRVSKEKQKLLNRIEGLEVSLSKERTTANKWLAVKASPVGPYLQETGRATDKIPSSISRDGDWIAPLLAAYKRGASAGSEAAMVAAIERHADLDEKRPAQCVCPACQLRRHIEEQKVILVNLKQENDRLLRDLDKERGKKVKSKRRSR